jgi:tetratricopeptide (TPR) repeat protein
VISRHDQATLVVQQAEAAVERLGGDEPVEATLSGTVGNLLTTRGRPREAEPHLRKALALAEKLAGPNSVQAAGQRITLAFALTGMGRHEESLSLSESAIAALEASGPPSPITIFAKVGLGLALAELLRAREAEPHLQQAVAIADAAGLSPLVSAYPLDQLGRSLFEQGKLAEAKAAHERAAAIYAAVDRAHPDRIDSAVGIARVHAALHQPARVIAVLEPILALDAPRKAVQLAEAKVLLARALRALRRSPARIRTLATEAQEAYRAALPSPRVERDRRAAEALVRQLRPALARR